MLFLQRTFQNFKNITEFVKKITEFEMCDQKSNVCFKNRVWCLKHKHDNLQNAVFILKLNNVVFGFQNPCLCLESRICVLIKNHI